MAQKHPALPSSVTSVPGSWYLRGRLGLTTAALLAPRVGWDWSHTAASLGLQWQTAGGGTSWPPSSHGPIPVMTLLYGRIHLSYWLFLWTTLTSTFFLVKAPACVVALCRSAVLERSSCWHGPKWPPCPTWILRGRGKEEGHSPQLCTSCPLTLHWKGLAYGHTRLQGILGNMVFILGAHR